MKYRVDIALENYAVNCTLEDAILMAEGITSGKMNFTRKVAFVSTMKGELRAIFYKKAKKGKSHA